jgi:4-amino-4-deoxy-L-arabinose transferase-like glycosyltransferase
MLQSEPLRGAPHAGAPEQQEYSAALLRAEALSEFDGLYVRRARRWLAGVLVAFAIVAVQYAALTPRWQAPDEPAHYNYVAAIAATGNLPALRDGDYNQKLLELLLKDGLISSLAVVPVYYESYQPPLYYVSAVPIYWATGGSLLALRLYNVFLALLALVVLYRCVELVFPGKPLIPLGATAFAALLPMHVAVAASVTNDVPAELLLLCAALTLLSWMRDRYYQRGAPPSGRFRHARLLLLGILLGLGLLTKLYAYVFLPIAAAAVVWTHWWHARTWRSAGDGVRAALWVALPALLMAAPMWARNMLLYGWSDPMGLHRHDEVVLGQPTTTWWIREYGVLAYFERAFDLTYRTFWGAFGWSSVMMSNRVYVITLIFSGVLFLGLLWSVVRLISGRPDADMDTYQVTVLVLLGVLSLAVFAAFVWYNLKFVQHQGRYFFWGMLAISTFVALAWREVFHPLQGTITGLMAAVLAVSLILSGVISGEQREWTIAIVTGLAGLLLVQPLLLVGRLPTRLLPIPSAVERLEQHEALLRLFGHLRFAAWALPFAFAFGLNLLVPWLYIVPQLVR